MLKILITLGAFAASLWPLIQSGNSRVAPVTLPTTQPSRPLDANSRFKIVGVTGLVQYRESPDRPWQKCLAGAEVGIDAEFRTGPRSSCSILTPDGKTITADRLGTRRLKAILEDPAPARFSGMPYGRTRYEIGEHEGALVTPSTTLAIRGMRPKMIKRADGTEELWFECVTIRPEPATRPVPAKR